MERAQEKLSGRLVLGDEFSDTETVGGIDQAFTRDKVHTCIFVMDSSFEVLERKFASAEITMPYIPGFLAFREIPSILKAHRKLETNPDIFLLDGHGIAHPRRFGIASQLGVVTDSPAVGVAKNVLVGEYEEPEEVGQATDLKLGGGVVGKVLKSKKGCNPIFVSPGHRISVEGSLELTRKYVKDHKLPEPIYQADRHVDRYKNHEHK